MLCRHAYVPSRYCLHPSSPACPLARLFHLSTPPPLPPPIPAFPLPTLHPLPLPPLHSPRRIFHTAHITAVCTSTSVTHGGHPQRHTAHTTPSTPATRASHTSHTTHKSYHPHHATHATHLGHATHAPETNPKILSLKLNNETNL
eukprot:357305-Chlamydomonas_euryale.AAC.2